MANSVWVGWLGSARVTTSGDSTVFPGSVTAPSLIADTLTLDIANQDIQLSRSATRALTLGPTTGVTLRWATDGLLEVRNVANDAAGSVNLLNLTATGIVTAPSMYAATSITLGSNTATYGSVRLGNPTEIVARNNTNSGNIQLLGVTAANLIELGNGGFTIRCNDAMYPGAALNLGRSTNPWGNFYANAYFAGATPGVDFSGAVTNLTVVKGIVTAAS